MALRDWNLFLRHETKMFAQLQTQPLQNAFPPLPRSLSLPHRISLNRPTDPWLLTRKLLLLSLSLRPGWILLLTSRSSFLPSMQGIAAQDDGLRSSKRSFLHKAKKGWEVSPLSSFFDEGSLDFSLPCSVPLSTSTHLIRVEYSSAKGVAGLFSALYRVVWNIPARFLRMACWNVAPLLCFFGVWDKLLIVMGFIVNKQTK